MRVVYTIQIDTSKEKKCGYIFVWHGAISGGTRRRTLIIVVAIGLVMALMMLYDGMSAGFNQTIYGNAIRVLGGNIQVHASGYSDNGRQQPAPAAGK